MAVRDARFARSAMGHADERAGVERQRVRLKGVPIVRVLSASVRASTQAPPRTIGGEPCGTRIRLLSPFSLRNSRVLRTKAWSSARAHCLAPHAAHAVGSSALARLRRALKRTTRGGGER